MSAGLELLIVIWFAVIALAVLTGILVFSVLRERWRDRTAGPRIVRLLTENPLQYDDPTPIEPIANESVTGFAHPEARRLLDERIAQWKKWHREK